MACIIAPNDILLALIQIDRPVFIGLFNSYVSCTESVSRFKGEKTTYGFACTLRTGDPTSPSDLGPNSKANAASGLLSEKTTSVLSSFATPAFEFRNRVVES